MDVVVGAIKDRDDVFSTLSGAAIGVAGDRTIDPLVTAGVSAGSGGIADTNGAGLDNGLDVGSGVAAGASGVWTLDPPLLVTGSGHLGSTRSSSRAPGGVPRLALGMDFGRGAGTLMCSNPGGGPRGFPPRGWTPLADRGAARGSGGRSQGGR